jgi:hypothetical protein
MLNGFDLTLVARNDNIVDVLIRMQAPDSPKTGLPERPRRASH